MRYKSIFIALIVLLIVLLHIGSYYGSGMENLIGFDSGMYVYKLKTGNLNFWDDPLFFRFHDVFKSIVGINEVSFLHFFMILNIVFVSLISIAISKRIGIGKKKSIVYYVLPIFVVGSVVVWNASQLALHKQIFTSIIFSAYILIKLIPRFNNFLLDSLFLSAIFLGHKAIFLLSVVWTFACYINSNKKKFDSVKDISIVAILSGFIVSPYLIPYIGRYVDTALDSIRMSLAGISSSAPVRSVAGQSIVSRSSVGNTVVDLIKIQPVLSTLIFIAILVVFFNLKSIRKEFQNYLLLIVFLFSWIFLGANFGNRFVYNFVLLLTPLVPMCLKKLEKRRYFFTVMSIIFVLLLIFVIENPLYDKPYVNPDDIDLIESIDLIEINNSIIFASDSTQTIFAQRGFLVAQYLEDLNIDLKTGEEVDKLCMQNSDNFLLDGHSNVELLDDYNLTRFKVYVVIDKWATIYPLKRSVRRSSIDEELWDQSSKFTKIYNGSTFIYGIYEYSSYDE